MTCWSGSLGMTIKVNHMEHMDNYPDIHGLLRKMNKGEFYSIEIEREKLLKDLSYQRDLFGKDRALDILFADGQVTLYDCGQVEAFRREDVMDQEVGRYYIDREHFGIQEGFRRGYNSSYLYNSVVNLHDEYITLNISHQKAEHRTLRINEGPITSLLMGLRGDQYCV